MKSIYFVFLSNFVAFVDLSVTFTFFSLECANKGLNEIMIGVIVSSEVIGRFLSNFLIEKLIVFEKRRLMIAVQIGLAVCVYNYSLIDFFDSSFLFGFLSLMNRVLQGFFFSNYSLLATSCPGDYTTDKSEYQKLMMFYGNSRAIGLSSGATLGALIYQFCDYKLTFVIIASINTLTVILFYFFADIPKSEHESHEIKANSYNIYIGCLKDRYFLLLFICALFSRIAYFFISVDYAVNMSTRFGLSASLISLYLAIPALITVFVIFIYGYWKWRGSARLHLQIGTVLFLLGTLFLAPCYLLDIPQEVWIVMLGLFLIEFSIGIYSTKLIEGFNDRMRDLFPLSPKSQLNRASANFFSINWTVSYSIGPIYIGITTFLLSMDYSVLIYVGFTFCIYIIYLLFGGGYLEFIKYYKIVFGKEEIEEEDEGEEEETQGKNEEKSYDNLKEHS